MQFEPTQYSLEDYQLFELYPFTSKNKRYFSGYRSNQNKSVRLLIYPIQLVNKEGLLQHLNLLSDITHPLLAKILRIIPNTILVTQNTELIKEEVIAVVIENSQNNNFQHYFQLVLRVGPLNEKIVSTLTIPVFQFVKFMREKGIKGGFNSEHLYIDRTNCKLRIDGYGDWKYFKAGEETAGDWWEVGKFIFTMFNCFPPYSQINHNDKFFSMLKKKNYLKFWDHTKRKNQIPNHVADILNMLFTDDPPIGQIQKQDFFSHARLLNQQEFQLQMERLKKAKQITREEHEQKNKQLRQKYQQANDIRMKKMVRGTQNELVSQFLYWLEKQQNTGRKMRECVDEAAKKRKELNLIQSHETNCHIIFALILTILSLNNKKDCELVIEKVVDHGGYISFEVKGDLEDEYEIDVEVKIEVVKGQSNNYINFICCNGTLMEKIWVTNYIKTLFSEI